MEVVEESKQQNQEIIDETNEENQTADEEQK